jgi:thiosulfate/3-mercaptopyruvate sulfurtransferase
LRSNKGVEVTMTDALKVHGAPNVKFVDGSHYLPNSGKSGRSIFIAGPRITGAQYFDIEDITIPPDQNPQKLPNMLPSPQLFAMTMDVMGIQDTDHVIVYGQPGCSMIHRAWYQFIVCGHPAQQTHVLAGSLEAWTNAGGPVDVAPDAPVLKAVDMWAEQGGASYQPRYSLATPTTGRVLSLADMKEFVSRLQSDKQPPLLDARAPERFAGSAPEPRPGIPSGHMPGAHNLFFMNLLDPADRTKLLPDQELKAQLEKAGVDFEADRAIKAVASCASGVTACTLVAALRQLRPDWPLEAVQLYDGSWTEWASQSDTPIVVDDK